MAGSSLTKCLICQSYKIYGQECVRCKEDNDGHWGGCSTESDYPCDCPYREQEARNGASTASGGGTAGAP